jgi:hypothetical protein
MGEGGGIQSTTRIQKTKNKNKQNKFFVRYQDLSRATVALKSHCGSQDIFSWKPKIECGLCKRCSIPPIEQLTRDKHKHVFCL